MRRADADLGEHSAAGISSKTFATYKQQRLDSGDAPASVNRVLQMVRAAFNLAQKRGEIARIPFVELANEGGNARQWFFSDDDTQAVLAHLPADGLADFAEWCAETGMRKSEAEKLTWQMLDGDVLRVPSNITKNRKPRIIPLGAELANIIERRCKARRVVSLDGSASLAEVIFHRGGGKRIGDFKKSWHSACVAAGVGVMVCPTCQSEGTEKICPACKRTWTYRGKLLHDFRRSCARRLLAAGVPTQVAKQLIGHVSDSMFSRYAIVDAALLLSAQKQVAQFRKSNAR